MLTAWIDKRSGIILMTEGEPPTVMYFDVSPGGSSQLERAKCEWEIYEKMKEKLGE